MRIIHVLFYFVCLFAMKEFTLIILSVILVILRWAKVIHKKTPITTCIKRVKRPNSKLLSVNTAFLEFTNKYLQIDATTTGFASNTGTPIKVALFAFTTEKFLPEFRHPKLSRIISRVDKCLDMRRKRVSLIHLCTIRSVQKCTYYS